MELDTARTKAYNYLSRRGISFGAAKAAFEQLYQEELKLKDYGTTEDGKFTLEEVACLGCCSLAPVIMIDSEVYGKLTPDKIRTILKSF